MKDCTDCKFKCKDILETPCVKCRMTHDYHVDENTVSYGWLIHYEKKKGKKNKIIYNYLPEIFDIRKDIVNISSEKRNIQNLYMYLPDGEKIFETDFDEIEIMKI